MHTYYGEYSEYGYSIFDTMYDEPIYTAGNSRLDSQGYEEPGTKSVLTLKEIRKFCIQTTHEICKESNGDYAGCKRVTSEFETA